MKQTAKILGIVSFVLNLLMSIIIVLVFLGIASNDRSGSSIGWTALVILFAMEFVLLTAQLVFAIKSVKSKGCCIGLIIIGILTLWALGILNIIGGAIGLGNFSSTSNRNKSSANEGSIGSDEILFDSTAFSAEKKYYYPVEDYNLFDLILNFRNAPEISVRLDDKVLPLKIRLYLNFGETVEDQTVAGFEIMSRFDLPSKNRTVIFQIVKDEQGKSALCVVNCPGNQELIDKVHYETSSKRLYTEVETGKLVENIKFNVRYGFDMRFDERENSDSVSKNKNKRAKEKKRETNVGGTVAAIISVVCFALAIVFIVLLACGVSKEIYGCVTLLLGCLLGGFISGVVGHMFAEDPSDGFAYYATFLQFWLVYGVIYIVKGIIKDAESRPSPPKEETVYVVYDKESYSDRELRLFESYCVDYRYFVGKSYSRFKDDLGNYWRSYDNNETFIKEDKLNNM